MALLGPGHDEHGPPGFLGLPVSGVDGRHVVAVDLDGVPPECSRALGIDVALPLEHGRAALPQPVHVEDRDQVARPVEPGVRHGLPHGSLGRLRVAHQDPHPGRALVDLHRQRHAEADGEALAERPRGHVDPRHLRQRDGVALERAAELAEREELLVGDGADGFQDRVHEGGSVALGQDEAVVGLVLRIGHVVPEVVGVEHGEQVRRRHGRGGVAGPGLGGRADAVHRELCRELVPLLDLVHPALLFDPFVRRTTSTLQLIDRACEGLPCRHSGLGQGR